LNTNISATRVANGKSALRNAPSELLDRMGPEKVSAMVAWLAHRECQSEAKIFEAGAGYFAQLNWARSAPLFATEKEGIDGAPLPEHIRDGQDILHDYASGDMPKSGDGAMGSPNALDWVLGHLKSQ